MQDLRHEVLGFPRRERFCERFELPNCRSFRAMAESENPEEGEAAEQVAGIEPSGAIVSVPTVPPTADVVESQVRISISRLLFHHQVRSS